MSESTDRPAALLHEINERTDFDPVERLREMAAAIALHQAQTPDRFLVLIRSEAELPDGLATKYRQSRRTVLKEFIRVIDEGIRMGQMRPTDPRTAALGIIGMLNWIAWWHKPGDPEVDHTTARHLADMAVRTVVADGDGDPTPAGPARAIAMLRQDLDYLERLLDES